MSKLAPKPSSKRTVSAATTQAAERTRPARRPEGSKKTGAVSGFIDCTQKRAAGTRAAPVTLEVHEGFSLAPASFVLIARTASQEAGANLTSMKGAVEAGGSVPRRIRTTQ